MKELFALGTSNVVPQHKPVTKQTRPIPSSNASSSIANLELASISAAFVSDCNRQLSNEIAVPSQQQPSSPLGSENMPAPVDEVAANSQGQEQRISSSSHATSANRPKLKAVRNKRLAFVRKNFEQLSTRGKRKRRQNVLEGAAQHLYDNVTADSVRNQLPEQVASVGVSYRFQDGTSKTIELPKLTATERHEEEEERGRSFAYHCALLGITPQKMARVLTLNGGRRLSVKAIRAGKKRTLSDIPIIETKGEVASGSVSAIFRSLQDKKRVKPGKNTNCAFKWTELQIVAGAKNQLLFYKVL